MGARGGSSHRTGRGLLTLEPSGIPAAPPPTPGSVLSPHGRSSPVPTSLWPVVSLVQAYLLLTGGFSGFRLPQPCPRVCPSPLLGGGASPLVSRCKLQPFPRSPKRLAPQPGGQNPPHLSWDSGAPSLTPDPEGHPMPTPSARPALKVAFPGSITCLCHQLAVCPEPRCFPLKAQFPHL